MKIDEVDISILRELRANARQSFKELAEKLDISEGTAYNRVKKLREEGVLKGFIADIDFSKIGYDLTAIIGLIVEGGKLPAVESKLADEPNISAVYDVTGEYDALVVAKFRDRDSLNALVKKILSMPDVKRTYTMVVLNVVKESHGIEL